MAGRFNLKLRAHFFNKIGQERRMCDVSTVSAHHPIADVRADISVDVLCQEPTKCIAADWPHIPQMANRSSIELRVFDSRPKTDWASAGNLPPDFDRQCKR